ncbi:MAG: LexA family transcriptional regulator [Candidatus Pacebacteria bacterium]|jgi:repressor LexA|nr:LexA family transcriptional regulator [Candidatus Paceibacterota bacterium]
MQKKREQQLEKNKQALSVFYAKERRMPSYAEAAKLFGYKSKDSAYKLIQKLLSIGVLDRGRDGTLLPKKDKFFEATESFGIRVLGLVEAGFPTPAEEMELDKITLDEWLIQNKDASFMLKVKGESMRDAGIRSGDYVIVERTDKAKEGQIVIAEVDGAWTMKYLRKDARGLYLEPANSAFKNIRPKETLSISAVVKTVIRKYD